MKTNCKRFRLAFGACIFFALCFITFQSDAQQTRHRYRPFYYGFKAGVGDHFFKLRSSIPQINNLPVLQEGGYAGLVIGNDKLKLSSELAGFFYSADRVPYTIDLVHSSVDLNFYPLEYLVSRTRALQPFISGGVGLSRVKFYGHYLKPENGVKARIGTDPFLGKINATALRLGMGLEYRVPAYDFVHLFLDARYEHGIGERADAPFLQTSIVDAGSITVGVCFGSLTFLR